MAANKTKKSQKQASKLSKITKIFNPSTSRGKMFIFLLSFAVIGGGYMVYASFAATLVPDQFTNYVVYNSVRAEGDGVTGPVQCRSAAGKTGYGYLANCMQLRNANKEGRMGWYSLDNRTFSPRSGWLPYIGYDSNSSVLKCRNMDYYFSAPGTLSTGYGPTRYGQVYRYATKVGWQIKWANMNMINGNCYLESSSWYNVTSFDNIQTN